jgi:hypothetical protein
MNSSLYKISLLTKSNAHLYQHLTYTDYVSVLTNIDIYPNWVAIGARYSTFSVGLILAFFNDHKASIKSINVYPPHDNKNLEQMLLNRLQVELRKLNITHVQFNFKNSDPKANVYANLFKQCDFSPVKPLFYQLRITDTHRLNEQKWLHNVTLPENFEFSLWEEVSEDEIKLIKSLENEPDYISPFYEKDTIEKNSLVLKYNKEIIGWMITNRISHDTIRYSTLYLNKKKHKLSNIPIKLIKQSVRLQFQKIDLEKQGVFIVNFENILFIRLLQTLFLPYGKDDIIYEVIKTLL